MAYLTYTTKAIVCGTFDRYTSDRSYLLFTREAGMLFAEARSVRMEKSKQRFALQDFSLVRVSLVKGKQTWRIGSVEALTNHYHSAVDKAARGSVVSVYRNLRRFFQGEEATPALFDFVVEALTVVSQTIENRAATDRLILIKILAELGYVSDKGQSQSFKRISSENLCSANQFGSEIKLQKLIDEAVTASHL